jgi:hypothetical protein
MTAHLLKILELMLRPEKPLDKVNNNSSNQM